MGHTQTHRRAQYVKRNENVHRKGFAQIDHLKHRLGNSGFLRFHAKRFKYIVDRKSTKCYNNLIICRQTHIQKFKNASP